jgi:hypothetical protein
MAEVCSNSTDLSAQEDEQKVNIVFIQEISLHLQSALEIVIGERAL